MSARSAAFDLSSVAISAAISLGARITFSSFAFGLRTVRSSVSGSRSAMLTVHEFAPYRTMMYVPPALELESARRPFFTVSAKFAE